MIVSNTLKQMKIGLRLLFIFVILTGIIYPTFVTLVAQVFFPWKANGSLINQNGKIIGSTLIGQSFTDSKYFWGRPSLTDGYPYNAEYSVGSSIGMSSSNYKKVLNQRIDDFLKDNLNPALSIPIDMVTASGSGLDPDISPYAAYYQIPRIAKARGMTEKNIQHLVNHYTEPRTFGFLGEPRVNVLLLNMALDKLSSEKGSRDGKPT